MKGIRDKVILVTGAGSPVGRATVLTLAEAGARVVVADPSAEQARLAAHEVRQVDGEVVAVAAALAAPGGAEAAVDAALGTFGRLDAAFNHVATTVPSGGVVDLREDAWRRVLTEDLTGVFLAMKHELPPMVQGGGGAVVNSASLLGMVGVASAPALTAVHHGVLGLTRAAALEVAGRGVRVNAVCGGLAPWAPARDRSRSQPRDTGRPEEVAATVAWLVSDDSASVTGQAVPVGDGYASPLLESWSPGPGTPSVLRR